MVSCCRKQLFCLHVYTSRQATDERESFINRVCTMAEWLVMFILFMWTNYHIFFNTSCPCLRSTTSQYFPMGFTVLDWATLYTRCLGFIRYSIFTSSHAGPYSSFSSLVLMIEGSPQYWKLNGDLKVGYYQLGYYQLRIYKWEVYVLQDGLRPILKFLCCSIFMW